jgi:hypothetical protein
MVEEQGAQSADAEDKKTRVPAQWVRLQTWETIFYTNDEILMQV